MGLGQQAAKKMHEFVGYEEELIPYKIFVNMLCMGEGRLECQIHV